jgi:hypothetical protein
VKYSVPAGAVGGLIVGGPKGAAAGSEVGAFLSGAAATSSAIGVEMGIGAAKMIEKAHPGCAQTWTCPNTFMGHR